MSLAEIGGGVVTPCGPPPPSPHLEALCCARAGLATAWRSLGGYRRTWDLPLPRLLGLGAARQRLRRLPEESGPPV